MPILTSTLTPLRDVSWLRRREKNWHFSSLSIFFEARKKCIKPHHWLPPKVVKKLHFWQKWEGGVNRGIFLVIHWNEFASASSKTTVYTSILTGWIRENWLSQIIHAEAFSQSLHTLNRSFDKVKRNPFFFLLQEPRRFSISIVSPAVLVWRRQWDFRVWI